MVIQMNDSQLDRIESLGSFLKSSRQVSFQGQERVEIYAWIEETLIRFSYLTLRKKEKGTLKKYLKKMTGYSRAQITRLVGQHRRTGYVRLSSRLKHGFGRRYSDEEIKLLAQTDELHEYPNGNALKRTLQRLVTVFGLTAYLNLSRISPAHIYNLRRSKVYQRFGKVYQPTRPTVVKLGERRKPNPAGAPGYLRVDTVHQGDRETVKGVYHINTVDEVTQFEFVGAVEKISEAYLVPLLGRLLENYPFRIVEFHSDNGSEFINQRVVDLLNRLLVKLTKSRSRRTNDNALVESKNGSVIRKWLGYAFIEQRSAERINRFDFGCFNEYLNYHRVCAFAQEVADPKKKGKIRKTYPLENYQTPYDKLKSLKNARSFLKEGITFTGLDLLSKRYDDNQMATIVQKEREKLFEDISLDMEKVEQLIATHRSGSLLD